ALRTRGALASLWIPAVDARVRALERQALMRLASGLLFGAAAYFNVWVGAQDGARAWAYAAIGIAAWVAIAAGGAALPELLTLLAPVGVAAMALAGLLAW